ncbi:hypothetical protein QJS04_geneDACA008142 [Acorus gramineus]|uniref:Cell division cycle protein 123 homolog n=1 Tax=Acorus gramineus TaxID=55184 RepID=A0AAV9AVK0_ACOGR|nr:hypothetical protein QJS04_geneDACA008142 [Acorus gramineus]
MREELKRCQIQEWYPKFKSSTIKTLIHELPDPFIHYLRDDSGPFLLPTSSSITNPFPNSIRDVYSADPESQLHSDSDSDDEFNSPSATPPSFPDLELEVHRLIMALGGVAFPKLNWSSPKDAAWISTSGTLQCASLADIALLFRSSDNVTHDLSQPSDRYYLALRKWYPTFRPDMEFRCFVRSRRLIAISQREVTGFYPSLLDEKLDLEADILHFFSETVQPGFESNDYTFDVYITRDRRVKLMDFNVWGPPTLPLLFEWEELEKVEDLEKLEFRIVEERCGVRPGLKTAVPYDYLDTSEGSGWDQFLRRAEEAAQRQVGSSESGS